MGKREKGLVMVEPLGKEMSRPLLMMVRIIAAKEDRSFQYRAPGP